MEENRILKQELAELKADIRTAMERQMMSLIQQTLEQFRTELRKEVHEMLKQRDQDADERWKQEADQQAHQLDSFATTGVVSQATNTTASDKGTHSNEKIEHQQRHLDLLKTSSEDATCHRARTNTTVTDEKTANQTMYSQQHNRMMIHQSKQKPIQAAGIRALLLRIEEMQRQVEARGSNSRHQESESSIWRPRNQSRGEMMIDNFFCIGHPGVKESMQFQQQGNKFFLPVSLRRPRI